MILTEEQNGFRSKRSTYEHIIFTLTSLIDSRISVGKGTFAAFIDFQKAYDSICHHLLWEKLKLCGISDVPLQMLYNNITSEVRISHHTIQSLLWLHVVSGRAVFCHQLFSIFISMTFRSHWVVMLKVSFFCNVKIHCLLYADDLVILAEDVSDLTCALKGLEQWCERWEIQINSKKSAYVHFRPRYQRGSPIDLVVVKW